MPGALTVAGAAIFLLAAAIVASTLPAAEATVVLEGTALGTSLLLAWVRSTIQ